MSGKVYLVGAGPGDPDLLTVKALRLLKTADAVLYDDLVSPEILRVIPSSARLHNVGKRCGKKKIQQEEINFLMIALADSGQQVVRLKSGDPMIFGRAGEEMEALRKAGVDCEVVSFESDARYEDTWREYYRLVRRAGVTQTLAKEAMRNRSTLIATMLLRRGDVDKGFTSAAHVFEHTFRTQKVLHLALEPCAPP